MQLTWATDIHLDFITAVNDIHASSRNLDTFCSMFGESDGVILSGDISLAPLLKDHLLALGERLARPIYFVLGNHDFWSGKFESVRKEMTELSNSSEYLKYLSAIPYIKLDKTTFIVGHDGWYDGLYGDASQSNIVMNDWMRIGDYIPFYTPFDKNRNDSILHISRQQADIATHHVATGIKTLLLRQKPQKIIVVTHVPPFTNPFHLTKKSKQDVYPWYASKTMGDMLLSAANSNPSIQFEVFCGHCHIGYEDYIVPNLLLYSGVSEYAQPKPQFTFDTLYETRK